jgi:hypothetical protein
MMGMTVETFTDKQVRWCPGVSSEVSSRQAQSQLRKFMPAVWWESPVEVHNAIEPLHRLGANQLLSQATLAAGFSVLELF